MPGRMPLLVVLLVAGLLGSAPATVWAQEAPTFTFSGEFRFRGEWDGRTVGVDDDAAVLSRIRVGVRADLANWMRAFAQLQDSRAWGSELSTLTDGQADYFDMHQGYVELGSGALMGRLGRQEVALGDERLIGSVGWSNTGRSFDGARMLGAAGGIGWQVFWMNVAERDSLSPVGVNPQVNQGINDDGWLVGGFASHAFGGTTAELTVVVDREAVTKESYTTNLRMHGQAGIVLYEAAGAYQFGPDRGAFLASGSAGVALGRTTVAAQVDYVSGDDDPSDGTTRAFNTLYATNHKFYGLMDYFLDLPGQLDQAGLVDAMLRGSIDLPQNVGLRLDLHRFSVAKERDARRALGTEIDLVSNVRLHRYAALQVGGAVFVPEPLATDLLPAFASGDDPRYWAYAQLTVRWP